MIMNEKEIIEKIKNNDLEAFEMIVDNYSKRLFTTIYRFTHNYEDTEDIIQEVWIKFYKNISKFRFQSSLYTFLYRIAVNASIKWLKKRERIEKLRQLIPFNKLLYTPDNAMEEVIRDEEIKKLKQGIDTLPKKQKAVFILRNQDKMSFKEIAQTLGINENSAKVTYHYAIKRLKIFLKEEEML